MDYRKEYKSRVAEVLREESVGMGEELEVDEVHETFKRLVIRTAVEVVVYKVQKGGRRRSEW